MFAKHSPVMFHVFPMVRNRENMAALVMITDTAYIIGTGAKEMDSPPEMEERINKYFELKNSWGAGAPLNSNYLLLLLYCSHPYYMNP